MNLFKELILSAPITTKLQFGHNTNVIISKVDIQERKREGLPIKAHLFITFQQIDPKTKKVVAEQEFSFWNLEHTSEFVHTNFVEEFSTLVGIITALGLSDSDFEASVVTLTGGGIDDLLVTKDGAKKVQNALQEAFSTMVTPVIGASCPLMKCKLTCNKNGFLEMEHNSSWILPMTSTEELPEITSREIKRRAEAQNATRTAKPDELGSPKPADNLLAPPTIVPPTPEKQVAKVSSFAGL